MRWLALAVSLAVVAAGLSWWLLRPEPVRLPIVVRNVGVVTENAQPLDPGRPLPPGELHLTDGLVELRSEERRRGCHRGSGAFPLARSRAIGTLGGACQRRSIEAAVGFTIETPEAELQDLGTRFGVDVSLTG